MIEIGPRIVLLAGIVVRRSGSDLLVRSILIDMCLELRGVRRETGAETGAEIERVGAIETRIETAGGHGTMINTGGEAVLEVAEGTERTIVAAAAVRTTNIRILEEIDIEAGIGLRAGIRIEIGAGNVRKAKTVTTTTIIERGEAGTEKVGEILGETRLLV